MELRDVEPDDLPILYEHQADPVACAAADFPSRSREAFFAHWRTRVLPEAANAKKAIVHDGALVGYVVAYGPPERRFVGYWLGRAHWGQGLASRALAELARLEPIRPLLAIVSTTNTASIRVLEKCGFTRAPEDLERELLRGEPGFVYAKSD